MRSKNTGSTPQPTPFERRTRHTSTSGVARLPLPSVYQPSNDLADLDGGDRSVVGTSLRADRVQYPRPRRPAGLQHGHDRVGPTSEGSVEGRSHVS